MGTARYLLGKMGQLFITLLLVLSLAFLLFRVWQPGDPVVTYARASGSNSPRRSSTRSGTTGVSTSRCRSSTCAT